jgi:hypothetical protein
MKTKRGGKRIGAGRKPKFLGPTKTVSFRIPEDIEIEFKEFVKDKLKIYEK